MKITGTELYVLLDGLRGSLKIADRLNIWSYDEKQRLDTLNNIINRMGQVQVEVAIPEDEGCAAQSAAKSESAPKAP